MRNPPLPYPPDWDGARSPARPAHARETNTRDLLRLLRRHAPCSRADLVRLSGLSAPTVSAAITTLEHKGLVTALGPGTSSGGRPPGLLQFNAASHYVIGIDIGATMLRVALADLNGVIANRREVALQRDRDPEAVVSSVQAAITQFTGHAGINPRRILHLAAGAPGITDVAAGKVKSAPNLGGWHDVLLRDLLRERTGIASTVENDVNLGALGESWCGSARNVRNFVFLAIGTGVGAGIVLDGSLHHGASWSAGEVGYMMLPGLRPDPPATDEPGALESAIGGPGIERSWVQRTGAQPRRATEIFDLAQAGNPHARELLSRVADTLAMAITNLSLTLDLSLVVLGGGVGAHPALLQAIQSKLDRNQFACPQLSLSGLKGEASLHGAIYLALQTAEPGLLRRNVGRSSAILEPAGATCNQ